MEQYLTQQIYSNYAPEDHETWKILCRRHSSLDRSKIAKVYLDGFDRLNIGSSQIPNISDISSRLKKISGWTLTPVTGLLKPKEFFLMLINKEYPVTVFIRKQRDLDFSEQPDIFHDIFGHLPLLMNEQFVKYLTGFCTIAIKYAENEKAIESLGRLYWYTYEMGLVREGDQNKPYGGAILTSSEEIKNIERHKDNIFKFNIDHIFNTSYNPFDLQNEYFYIDSFEELFQSLSSIEKNLTLRLEMHRNATL